MNNIYKTAIIGGGASGLMCAVELCLGDNPFFGKDVIILENNDRVGKKLIATGNGQGNLSNASVKKADYHGNEKVISAFLQVFNALNLRQYLYKLGIPLTQDEKGRIYPLSKQASAVLDVLRAYLSHNGVTEKTSFKVNKISHNGKFFIITDGREEIYAKTVVCAFGGATGKQFGTDGTAYSLLAPFNHKVTKIYPSLVQIKTDVNSIRGLKGLKEYAKITVYDGEKELKSAEGDVLFTDYGISGNAVFSVSGYLAQAKSPQIEIEFLPQLSEKQVEKIISDKKQNYNIQSVSLLSGILNKRVGQAALKTAKSDSEKDVAFALKHFKLKYAGTTGFNNAQVTKGGIDCKDIDEFTLESKNRKGLYVIGEALDVDGDCGGYNLTFAFVTGITCARHLKNNY